MIEGSLIRLCKRIENVLGNLCVKNQNKGLENPKTKKMQKII